ncbi:transposase, IS4 family protein [Sphaerospermopsis reniformis]|uniref:Transposase, IS4 family protein n=1 Tax=Sphaerospermopsis reniformis TaxID=531300 RepID=A0A480A5L2_9CYAN|nr:transposase, IS4 family protein [Sphaerospermopsis reniformis]
MRKQKSKRPDPPWIQYIKQHTRHYIETVFSSITIDFTKSIHAVTYQGFLLKVQAFIFAFTLQEAFI